MIMIAWEDLTRVSWSAVHFTASLPAEAAPDGLVLARLDGTAVGGDGDLLSAVARALAFPAYFGLNWDALEESLRDLAWLPGRAYSLVVDGADPFWRRHPRAAGTLVEVWLAAAEEWAAEGVAFHLVFVW